MTKEEFLDEYQLALLDRQIALTREVLAMDEPPEEWRDVLGTAREFLNMSREEQEEVWFDCGMCFRMCGMALNNANQ